jgi:hypothetical protein
MYLPTNGSVQKQTRRQTNLEMTLCAVHNKEGKGRNEIHNKGIHSNKRVEGFDHETRKGKTQKHENTNTVTVTC